MGVVNNAEYLNVENSENLSTKNIFEEGSSGLEIKSVVTNPNDSYTVQQAVNIFGFGWFHVKLSLLVGLCWMADSMEMTILSIIGPAMFCEWRVTKYQQALITTVVFLGMMLSSTFWTQLSNRYGRKPALTLCGVLLVLYSILSSVSPSYAWLLILRGLVGFSIGCVPQSVTLYAEFLPTKHKGKCVVLMDCFWALGACFEVVLAFVVYPYLGWRWLLGLSATPLLIFTILSPWLTESARYHALNGRTDKAVKVLEDIAKNNNRHMLIGRLVTDGETNSMESFSELLRPGLRKTTLLLWFIWMACAFSYYGLVLMTTELIVIRNVENSSDTGGCITFLTTDFMDLLWITLSEFPGILITIKIIKRFGKRRTMAFQYIAFIGCVVLLSLHSGRFYSSVLLFLARGIISGLFQSAYNYTPDIYPSSLRSIGVAACSAIARVGAMITPFVAQVVIQTSVSQAFFIYSAVGFFAAIACAFLPQERSAQY